MQNSTNQNTISTEPEEANTVTNADAVPEEQDRRRRGLGWRHAAMAVSAGMFAAAAGAWTVRRRRAA